MATFDSGGGSTDSVQFILGLIKTGWGPDAIATNYKIPLSTILSVLGSAGYVTAKSPDGRTVVLSNTGQGVPTTGNPPASTAYQQSTASGLPPGTKPPTKPGAKTNNSLVNPNAQPDPNAALLAALAAQNSGSASAAADLAERKREFNVTTSRDVAKQNASEVDSLQQRLAGLSGPKDTYADYFFSHGLLPPQGYKPAPVPFTQAQLDAYKKMGVTPQQLQGMIGGTGQPGANYGMLGSLGSSLQTAPGMPQPQRGVAPTGAQAPSNPTMQGGALYGATPPGGSNVATPPMKTANPQIPTTPGGVPSMAVGGEVPGPPGTPKLAVLHGGEEVTPAPQQPNVTAQQPPMTPGQNGAMSNQPGLHPAISALVDAVSNLLSNPDFQPFVQASQQTTQATPGGVPSMASGGTVPGQTNQVASQPGSPLFGQASPMGPGPQMSGLPSAPAPPPLGAQAPPQMGAGQGTMPNSPAGPDNPVMPIGNMDPYTRALYDIHGRLHPYSAQQEMQMGPQGIDAVSSYVSKVQGGDINAYKGLVDRLRPNGAPQMGDLQGEGFLSS